MGPTTSRPRILLADDDAALRRAVSELLTRDGFDVVEAGDGHAALQAALDGAPDGVVLDINLPLIGGLEVLTRVRQSSDVPVLLLTGRADERDRVLGLELGADDYVVKPFFSRELSARVRALLRRANGDVTRPADVLEFDDLAIDTRRRIVTVRGDEVELTAREFDLLAFLALRPGKVFTRAQLLAEVWSSSTDWQNPATVTEHVYRVRTKIDAPSRPTWIRTVPRVGYSFNG